jgi:Uma2 family endonuclease
MAVQLARKLFTIDDYHRMAEVGILSEDDRVELIDGEIVLMSPIGKHHAGTVNRLAALLHQALGGQVVIAVQNPVMLSDDTELEPDIAVLRFRDDYYAQELPTPPDAHLIIEVSDTTLVHDRSTKVPLYARNRVSDVWIVNLQGETVEVSSQPEDGTYQLSRQVRRGAPVSIPGFPDISLSVNDILG